jgi:hypothetical protein
MSTLTITIGIVAPVITFLIGRYFRSESKQNFKSMEKERDYWDLQYNKILANYMALRDNPQIQIVPNINPHHAADKEYIGIYPNNGLEPAHLTREEYQKGVKRLKDNPEDNILTNKN